MRFNLLYLVDLIITIWLGVLGLCSALSDNPGPLLMVGIAMKAATDVLWLPNILFVIYIHVIGVLAILYHKPHYMTLAMSFLIWSLSGIGITMGYHRLWSHRAYKASILLQILLAILGTLGFQGSIKWWVERHRLHHRFTDTEDDPYNAKRGLFYSHIGWIFRKRFYRKLTIIDTTDLTENPSIIAFLLPKRSLSLLVIMFQHRFYVFWAILFNMIVPVAVAHWYWRDALRGFLFGFHVTKIMTWHSTFSINSLAHWVGSQDYSQRFSAKNNLWLAFITNGEGYHNFHHEFPHDYRNGVRWFDYDPTKWLIKLCESLGLAWNLRTVGKAEIEKALIMMEKRMIQSKADKYSWGPSDKELPEISKEQYQALVRTGKLLVAIDGLVYDISEYSENHPGGKKVLHAFVGRDATSAFNGGLNIHSDAAKRQARLLAVAKLKSS